MKSKMFKISIIAIIVILTTTFIFINKNNSNTMFSEILESLPEENHQLYVNLCENIAGALK